MSNEAKFQEEEVGRVSALSAVDASFCAGFFDAEGTFALKRQTEVFAQVSLYNNNLEILNDVSQHLGGVLRSVARKKRSEKHADSYVLDFTSQDVNRKLLETLRPFLVLKKKQCEILLGALNSAPAGRVAFLDQLHEANKKAQQYEAIRVRKRTDLSLPKDTDWAYLAGWLEGDGCFTLQPQKYKTVRYWYPWVHVYSSKPEVLFYLQERFGGNLKSRIRKANWAPECKLAWEDQKEVKDLLEHLFPFMRAKKHEAEILLEACSYPACERQIFRELLDECDR